MTITQTEQVSPVETVAALYRSVTEYALGEFTENQQVAELTSVVEAVVQLVVPSGD